MSNSSLLFKLALAEARHHGIGALLRTLRRQIWRREEYGIYAATVNTITATVTRNPAVQIQLATSDDLEAWRSDKRLWAVELWWDRLHGARRAYLGLLDDDPVHIAWVFGPHEPNKYFELNDHEAMIGPCLTYPWARGKGVYPSMIAAISEILADEGIEQIYMLVEKRNTASIRGVEKAGLRHNGRVSFLRIGPLRRRRVHRDDTSLT